MHIYNIKRQHRTRYRAYVCYSVEQNFFCQYLLTISVYQITNDLRTLQDWNTFLLRFNELDFCISENETLKHGLNESTTPESTVTSSQSRTSTQAPLLLEDPGPINISVTITLTLDPLKPFGGYSRNITHLYSTVMGHQVGLAGKCVVKVVLNFPPCCVLHPTKFSS